MEVDDGNTADKIAEIQSHLKEEGVVPQSTTPTPQQQQASSGTTGSSSNFNNNCYSSLPTMVGLQSAIAPSPDPSSQVGTQSRLHFYHFYHGSSSLQQGCAMQSQLWESDNHRLMSNTAVLKIQAISKRHFYVTQTQSCYSSTYTPSTLDYIRVH